MYRAVTSFTTKDYEIRQKQILEDDFTSQDEINEFLSIGYIEEYDGSLEITENGIYDVEDYQTADVDVQTGNLSDEEYEEANDDLDDILENTEVPSGTINITQNGEYDVTNYTNANVNIGGSIENYAQLKEKANELSTSFTEYVYSIPNTYNASTSNPVTLYTPNIDYKYLVYIM